ncbi:translation initiation factor 2 [Pseudomonas sp. LJDD11]|uniref:translation initiation factor 2 n=1 Tax=Pseudomonas sp. LJDD11 TaxID=2931984 RepID=UPI00211C8ED0|nr:translation initiation factor 2 [Pseudomonas sp. LJDD11]MCQ9423180.1 translation initiation factor 2 [Pseudomonas sp. LJDD11]
MTVFRLAGLLVVVLLCGCDAREPSAPRPKTEAASAAVAVPEAPARPVAPSTAEKPVAQVVSGAVADKHEPAPVHSLAPSVPVKPVVLDKNDFGVASKPVAAHAQPEKAAKAVAGAEPGKPGVSKSSAKTVAKADRKELKAKGDKVPAKNVRIGNAKLDLSLPQELVRELEPPANVISGRRKPLLPPMFGDKANSAESGSFELGGRIISNEMQLQMRNDNRRDVDGAALDFKFRQ